MWEIVSNVPSKSKKQESVFLMDYSHLRVGERVHCFFWTLCSTPEVEVTGTWKEYSTHSHRYLDRFQLYCSLSTWPGICLFNTLRLGFLIYQLVIRIFTLCSCGGLNELKNGEAQVRTKKCLSSQPHNGGAHLLQLRFYLVGFDIIVTIHRLSIVWNEGLFHYRDRL